jgi:hypothetical protein
LLIAVTVLVVLAAAPAASAGGWATVGLSSTPAGTQPGTPWVVELTVLQHGRTPLVDVEPTVTIRNGDAQQTFPAAPVGGKPGVYRAEVVFPTAGTWTYEVADGFVSGIPHTFGAVEIGAPASAAAAPPSTVAGDDGGPSPLWLGLGIGLLALAAAVLLVRDRRRPRSGTNQPQAA